MRSINIGKNLYGFVDNYPERDARSERSVFVWSDKDPHWTFIATYKTLRLAIEAAQEIEAEVHA